MKWLRIKNTEGYAPLAQIPTMAYEAFYKDICDLLSRPGCHAAEYFAVPRPDGATGFYALVADDAAGDVLLASHILPQGDIPESLTAACPQMHPFEREIAELHGIRFGGDPWPKPLRYPAARPAQNATLDNHPFYHIGGDSLHEVNVGPIHAGVIEPGAFRFICHGEKVLHLEIALGYQHRDMERLICAAGSPLRRACLAESIAGDSAIAHATAHAMVMERLAGRAAAPGLEIHRAAALELERMAMHLADIGALCMDIGYQLGQVACEALRTVVINTTQRICGNRFGKGFIRPGGTSWTIGEELAAEIIRNMEEVERRFAEVIDDLKSSPSVLSRFEECGVVAHRQAFSTGIVGMAARASGLGRDIRASHPWGVYAGVIGHQPVVHEQGDVMARMTLRAHEIVQSGQYVKALLARPLAAPPLPDYALASRGASLSFALVEGWRGEVCHVALTDAGGALKTYKIKDPSMHNWLALALSVRDGGISDFPICNKSFNLSYCGHDL